MRDYDSTNAPLKQLYSRYGGNVTESEKDVKEQQDAEKPNEGAMKELYDKKCRGKTGCQEAPVETKWQISNKTITAVDLH